MYENVPTFCFICGIVVGHSERLCSRLFDTPEYEIVKPCDAWMRAPFRRQVKPIGATWLHNGMECGSYRLEFGGQMSQFKEYDSNPDFNLSPKKRKMLVREGIREKIFFKRQ